MFTRLALSYNAEKLANVERQRLLQSGAFVTDKTMSFAYYPDGNLMTLTEHRPALNGQPELINSEPYKGGWIMRLKPAGEPQGLLSAAEYQAHLAAEG